MALRREQENYLKEAHDDAVITRVVRPKMEQETRWNSTFSMIERALVLKQFLARACALPDISRRMKKVQTPREEDWYLIKKVAKVLGKVALSSRILEGERYVSASIAYPILDKILTFCGVRDADRPIVIGENEDSAEGFLRKSLALVCTQKALRADSEATATTNE